MSDKRMVEKLNSQRERIASIKEDISEPGSDIKKAGKEIERILKLIKKYALLKIDSSGDEFLNEALKESLEKIRDIPKTEKVTDRTPILGYKNDGWGNSFIGITDIAVETREVKRSLCSQLKDKINILDEFIDVFLWSFDCYREEYSENVKDRIRKGKPVHPTDYALYGSKKKGYLKHDSTGWHEISR